MPLSAPPPLRGVGGLQSYRALCLSQKKVPEGVFISTTFSGSPASMYKLHSRTWVTKVNKQVTPDLDTLVDVVSRIEDGATVRLKASRLGLVREGWREGGVLLVTL